MLYFIFIYCCIFVILICPALNSFLMLEGLLPAKDPNLTPNTREQMTFYLHFMLSQACNVSLTS